MPFPWFIVAVGAAGLLQDSWPTALQWPAINLHAVFGALVLCMVLVQMQRSGLPDALRRQLSRAVFLQLYLVFGMSQIVHLAALLWNSSSLGTRHPAILPPPENLRDYLAYGVFVLLTIRLWALLQPAPQGVPTTSTTKESAIGVGRGRGCSALAGGAAAKSAVTK